MALQEDGNPAAAEAVLRDALEKDPNMVDALNWLGNAMSLQCKADDRLESMERAARLDPLNGAIAVNLASTYILHGDFDRAERQLLSLLELPDPGRYPFIHLRDFYKSTGRLADLNLIEKRRALAVGYHHSGLVFLYSVLGLWEEASYWAQRSATDSDHFWGAMIPAYALARQGEFEKALAEYDRGLAADGIDFAQTPYSYRLVYGDAQALAGDHAGAIRTLEAEIDTVGSVCYQQVADWQAGAFHALAWSYMEEGVPEKAISMLQSLDRNMHDLRREGLLHKSEALYFFAQNTLLLGDHDLALERLEQAIAAGWRDYYAHLADPRWAVLGDNPRHKAMMAEVKADLDRQRIEVERIDAEEDFVAKLDRARVERQQ